MEATFEQTWANIGETLETILKNSTKPISIQQWTKIYNEVVTYCTRSSKNSITTKKDEANVYGKLLYTRLGLMARVYIDELLTEMNECHDEGLLDYYARAWKSYSLRSSLISKMLDYLNRYWYEQVKKEGYFKIDQSLVIVWREHLFTQIVSELTAAVMNQFDRMRSGENVNLDLIKTVLYSAIELDFNPFDAQEVRIGLYKEQFENRFLQETRAYYIKASNAYLEMNSIRQYLCWVTDMISSEQGIVEKIFHVTTQPLLALCCKECLIRDRVPDIQKVFPAMILENAHQDLSRMYDLLKRVDGALDPIRKQFGDYIIAELRQGVDAVLAPPAAEAAAPAEGPAAAAEEKAQKKSKGKDKKETVGAYISVFAEIYKKRSAMIRNDFMADQSFTQVMHKAFFTVINDAKYGIPSFEYLSLFVDSYMKSKIIDTETPIFVETLIFLITTLQEKDQFEHYYKSHFGKRLLDGKSINEDLEMELITKFRPILSQQFTTKLTLMINDIRLSLEFHAHFNDSVSAQKVPFTFNVRILTAATWSLVEIPVDITQQMRSSQEAFAGYYSNANSGRSLAWYNAMGTVDIIARYSEKTYEISMSTIQYLMMQVVYNSPGITITQLAKILMGSDDSYRSNQKKIDSELFGLILSKPNLLVKSDSAKKIGENDTLEINAAPVSKLYKFKIGVAVAPESKTERDGTKKKVDEDRCVKIDAAIVRIMKARKSLDHANLNAEVINQLRARFNAEPPMIKKRIESLIEREYLRRSEADRKVYEYLA